jgi:hypothetical protein
MSRRPHQKGDGAWAEAGLTGGRTVGGLVTGGELGEKAGSRGSGSSAGGSTLTSGAMGNACTAGDETADGAASIWQTSCVRASAWASVVETKGISVIGLSGGADWERERHVARGEAAGAPVRTTSPFTDGAGLGGVKAYRRKERVSYEGRS